MTQNILQSYSNLNIMIMAERKICRQMEQNESRNKSTHIESTDLQQACQEYTTGKG